MRSIKQIIIVFLCICSISCTIGDQEAKLYNQGINLTPYPSEMKIGEGVFNLNSNTTIKIEPDSEELRKITDLFTSKIKASTGFAISRINAESDNQLRIAIDTNLQLKAEGYILKSDNEIIDIKAKDANGAFYAMQTLLQLLPAEIESLTLQKNIEWNIPSVAIKDEPRFAYRGFLMDVSRHFRDVDFVKKQLDLMSMLKINKLHWHLTDDQGWRIQIKKYPKLTSIGSQRKEHNGDIYGPFYYTQEEIKEIVAYAKERYIEVIPEIDLPGHSVAAVSAYPEYSCTGGPHKVRNVWGISSDIFCAGNEKTFEFLEDILDEVVPLFESKYFHIGGDEADKAQWEKCPKCQQKIKELKLRSDNKGTAENKLQSYFMNRLEQYLAKSGRKIIGWEEMLDGGLSPTATLLSWRGLEKGKEAADLGNDVIMAPRPWMYLDQYQGDSKLLPTSPNRLVSLEKTYSLDPIPTDLDESKHKHILGVQAATWAEYIYSDELFEWFTYPRLIALAEVGWSLVENKNYSDFLRRLDNQRVRLDMHDVKYYIPLPEQKDVSSCNFVAFVDSTSLDFKTTEPATIVYTTDGTEPTENSKIYEEPLRFTETTTLKMRSLLVSGKLGAVRTIQVEKQSYQPGQEKNSNYKGLTAKYYAGFTSTVEELSTKKQTGEEIIATPEDSKCRIKNSELLTEENATSAVIEGYVNIPEDDVYYFSTDCDQFWLNDQLFISNENVIRRHSINDKSIALGKGYHKIKIIRLANIFGGWVPHWQPMSLMIRADKEVKWSKGIYY